MSAQDTGNLPELEPGRDILGRFTKGNTFTPKERPNRRASRYKVAPLKQDIEQAMQGEFPLKAIFAGLKEILDDPKTPKRTKLDTWKVILEYAYGKPVQRQINANFQIDKLKDLFADDDDDDAIDGEVISGE